MRALPNFFLLFPSKVFFLALLPPILFNSGYQLQRELFYRHFGAIALFSIGGTVLSAFGAGGFLWFLSTKGWLGDAFNPTPLELLTFGALIAATDTVSVVGVLQRKRVDPHLFSLVFGESALNDAVALVLFKTLADFLRQNAMQNYDNDNNIDLYKNVGKYLLDLLVQCVVSPILGLVFASLMGLAFKHGRMRDHKVLELSLYIMPVYIPFMLSELLELSGMITIFFTGIFARRYMEPNVSEETREYARIIFRLLAFLAEVCIFLELGLSVCGMHKGHFSWPFVSWAFVAALLGRAIGVYPLKIPERKRDKIIPVKFMHLLWFAGLRGAVAYACAREFPDVYGHRDEFIAATMVIVVITIVLMGGATEPLMDRLGIRMNVDNDEYMRAWHQQRKLKGKLLHFGTYVYIYIYINIYLLLCLG
ncbi:Sodium/hydrogen exchanger [Fragilariopsis cylindrus CCMP1102]|uniref:Sodium/hydrogen exchanger 8 n=1 Tax=Fragilariopsis cylindrus CCMP1102 TaxID=635003 RepID=A0A1E7F6W0_9STRA|nr:Sodium/hydrogen exchanger [Fragilariopsis cylindrus CCMP1102]|eukprot:OEU13844.1 Sodium/hydrogen exchanger [Fragilariopsis cylindrus CCMP1102]